MQDLLTVDEVAELLKLNPETVRQKIRKGDIPGFFKLGGRDWRIKRIDLNSWIDSMKNSQEKQAKK